MVNQVDFLVFLNNHTAGEFGPIYISGRHGVPIYKDYVVLVPKDSDAKEDLWLDLHPDKYSKAEYYNAYLNGVEIFKLSYVDTKNLVGLNPSEKKSSVLQMISLKTQRNLHSFSLDVKLLQCVYKGSFEGGASLVAIKRANPMSQQGVVEFEESYTSLSTTDVKGSTGYIDLEYYQRHMLIEKYDLYSL
ncbi:hypothetical protein RYX36_007336, partial [Vicia faba]